MAKNDLLKEAIADAKAVRETALANAKIALEEAFTPRLQSMLSAKLSEEEEMEEPVAEEEVPAEDTMEESEDGMGGESEDAPSKELHTEEEGEEVAAEEPMAEEGRGEDVEEDLELEAIIKELEDEMGADEEPVAAEGRMNDEDEDPTDMHSEAEDMEGDGTPEEGPAMEEGEEGEDVSIDEIIKALREEEGEEESVEENDSSEIGSGDNKVDDTSGDLDEAYKVIKFLRSKINEVNLLNAKLLFSNKLFRNHSLNEGQKMKVIENFDRAQSLREVKLVFATLSESFNLNGSRTKRSIKESYASKSTRSTAPSKKVISEGSDLSNRWKKLANLS